ncbi:CoA ester lyase [Balamuthia mandrillaris]
MRVQGLAKPREALLRTTAVYLFSRPNARTLHQDAAAPQQIEQLSARSLLFVPGRTKLLDKALSSDWRPDVLMPDMEDSVPPEQKVAAREAIQDFLPRLATKYDPLNTKLIPRVNSFTTGLMEEDLRAVIGNHIYGVSIGKVGSADELALIDECLTKLEHEWLQRHNDKPIGKTRLVPWLETGNGIANAREICSASCRVVGVAFGADDFLTDMGLQSSSSDDRSCATLLDHARAQIAIAARAASIVALESPVRSPLRTFCRRCYVLILVLVLVLVLLVFLLLVPCCCIFYSFVISVGSSL